QPRFVKQYAQVGTIIREAVEDYAREVREGKFPGPEHSFAPEERVAPSLSSTNKS
ncbi:MAG: 3-methyl-2-oxobutanoate hydroxymethyltransferase, partial [Terriglobia bacterium]